MSKKLELYRVKDGNLNTLEINTPDGQIIVKGTDKMMKDFFSMMEESATFTELMRENLQGLTRKDIADEMRFAGFSESTALDMEDRVIWADIIE